MANKFHNGTNIIAKHDTFFLREEILEFFMEPAVKKKKKNISWCPGAEGSSPLTCNLKVQLASLTGSNRGRYHSGPLESAGVVHWKNRFPQMLDHNPYCC